MIKTFTIETAEAIHTYRVDLHILRGLIKSLEEEIRNIKYELHKPHTYAGHEQRQLVSLKAKITVAYAIVAKSRNKRHAKEGRWNLAEPDEHLRKMIYHYGLEDGWYPIERDSHYKKVSTPDPVRIVMFKPQPIPEPQHTNPNPNFFKYMSKLKAYIGL